LRNKTLKDLQSIPGVGKSMAEDPWNTGFRSSEDLKGLDPEKMYLDFQKIEGGPGHGVDGPEDFLL